MSRINKLTTSFIKITNALDKTKNQDEYNIYVSMLDEELECLKYVQRLRKYNNKQQLPSPTDTNDESKPEKKKRGRTKKLAENDDVVMSEPTTTSEEATLLPPSPISLERC